VPQPGRLPPVCALSATMLAPTLGEGLAPPLGGSPAPQVEDKIMDIASFAKFMEEHIKVENKTGALGTSVTVAPSCGKYSRQRSPNP
jgi:hypothetical protein